LPCEKSLTEVHECFHDATFCIITTVKIATIYTLQTCYKIILSYDPNACKGTNKDHGSQTGYFALENNKDYNPRQK